MSLTIGDNIKILQILQGHKSDVTTCDLAPNFSLITGSSDKTVRVWDWKPGSGYVERSNSPLKNHKYQVTCVIVSPQGSMVVSASVDGTAILYSFHSLQKLFTMNQINGDAIRVCRFSPDSSILVTAGDNGAVCVWDLVHRSLIRSIFEHEGTTQSLAFTADSQFLISACSLEVVRVWFVQDLVDTTLETNCLPIARFDNAHDLGICCVDVSKVISVDENNPLIKYYTMATSGNTNEIKIWTILSTTNPKHKNASITNKVVIDFRDTYDGHNSSVTCIKFTNNGSHLISASLDKLIKIWSVEDGNCIANLEGHQRYVNCITISKNSTIIVSGTTGSNDKQIFVWDLNGDLTFQSELFKSHRKSFGNLNSATPEWQLIRNAENSDNDFKIIEKIDDIADGAINCCCFSANGFLATASGDKLVRLFKIIDDNIEETEESPLESHTYAVNFVDFNNVGTLLATCSLDGCTNIWNPITGEKIFSLPQNDLAIKTCRFSPNGEFLITAGDDEKATVWATSDFTEIVVLDSHLDAITSVDFSPDTSLISTTSFNGDFRLWTMESYDNLYTEENGHDGGIQCCEFSRNLEPIPNSALDIQAYLFATCGNDCLVKLWRISATKQDNFINFDDLEVKIWRSLLGHGSNVIFVRFSPNVGEFVCSTATDRQARIWSVYSADCLYVLDHDSIVTTCAFSMDSSLLAVGCLDKTLWLWKMPQQLVFQTAVASKIKCRSKALINWTLSDLTRWLKTINFIEITENIKQCRLDGQKLITLPTEQICSGMDLTKDQSERFTREIRWLKKDQLHLNQLNTLYNVPHEFLCPITHEVMREPVTCSDGFTYEKNAIAEWFMAGKSTSPLTNEKLPNTEYIYNQELRNAIHLFLDENQ